VGLDPERLPSQRAESGGFLPSARPRSLHRKSFNGLYALVRHQLPEDALPRIASHAPERVAELLPRQWKQARERAAAVAEPTASVA